MTFSGQLMYEISIESYNLNQMWEIYLTFSYSLLASLCFANICVKTPLGALVGKYDNFTKGIKFLGVPYALPPLGRLRFQLPHSPLKWTDDRCAYEYMDACWQQPGPDLPHMPFLLPNQKQSEDCLYLDVYVDGDKYDPDTQAIKSGAKMPVVVFIHGGSFTGGSSAIYDFSLITYRKGIVAVTFQYRLGVFGFLQSSDDQLIPGNIGLHDQVAALKWVKNYISSFGGDPEQITLMGQSAGAISIAYHMVSPLSQNIFKQVIMESGSIFSYPVKNDATMRKDMNELLKYTGCRHKTEKESLKCLQYIDPEGLIGFYRKTEKSFVPTVDSRFFVNQLPIKLFKTYNNHSKPHSVLIGHNGNEGAMFLSLNSPTIFPTTYITVDPKISKRMAKIFLSLFGQDSKLNNLLIDLAYEGVDGLNRKGLTNRIGRLIGDLFFACSNLKFLNLFMKRNPRTNLHYYHFVTRPKQVFKRKIWSYITQAIHSEELFFVFGAPFMRLHLYTAQERKLSARMMDTWAEFIKTGKLIDKSWPVSKFNGSLVTFKYASIEDPGIIVPKKAFPPNRCDELPTFAEVEEPLKFQF